MFHKCIIRIKSDWSVTKILVTIAIVLTASSVVSCASQALATVDPIPGVDIPIENINTYMKLYDAPELMNSYKNGDSLNFRIVNLSHSNIVFPENFHAKVFKQESGRWVEIQNSAYNSGGKFILPTKDSYPLGLLVVVLPITEITSPTTVRVSINGYLEENEQVRVGAYADVQLNP